MMNQYTNSQTNSEISKDIQIKTCNDNDFLPPTDAETRFDPVKGEKALWQAVITQALMDARCESKKSEAIEQKRQALVWLRGENPDFVLVCHNANLDPSYIRKKCKEAIARGCKWRADARIDSSEDA